MRKTARTGFESRTSFEMGRVMADIPISYIGPTLTFTDESGNKVVWRIPPWVTLEFDPEKDTSEDSEDWFDPFAQIESED